MNTAIFYGSSTGNSEHIAKELSDALNNIEYFDISTTTIHKILEYDKVIIGLSTWGDGDLQDDWDEIWNDFEQLDLSNKTIALFGLGDQESYADGFANALGTTYQTVIENNATVIGFTSIQGYDYEESSAEIDGRFCGLVIDEDNQSELSTQRISNWVKEIKNEIL